MDVFFWDTVYFSVFRLCVIHLHNYEIAIAKQITRRCCPFVAFVCLVLVERHNNKLEKAALANRAGGRTPRIPPGRGGGGLTYAQGPHVISVVKNFWVYADV